MTKDIIVKKVFLRILALFWIKIYWTLFAGPDPDQVFTEYSSKTIRAVQKGLFTDLQIKYLSCETIFHFKISALMAVFSI